MSIFDKLKGTVSDVAKAAREAVGSGNQTETIVIGKLPESLEELKALPEAAMDTPFKTAALTVCALCAYAADKEIGISMLDFLRGPADLSPRWRSSSSKTDLRMKSSMFLFPILKERRRKTNMLRQNLLLSRSPRIPIPSRTKGTRRCGSAPAVPTARDRSISGKPERACGICATIRA